jgi:hypothetical protein
MITRTPCVLLLTKLWPYAYLFLFLQNMCCFRVALPLDVRFERDIKADAAVWLSNNDLVYAQGLITGFWRRLW